MSGEIVPLDTDRGTSNALPALLIPEPPARLLAVAGGHQSLGDALAAMARMGPEALFDASIDAIESGTLMVAVGGWGLSILRDAAVYGDAWYMKQAARRRVSKDTIYRAINAYKALMACPAELFASMRNLEPTKLSKLKNLDDDEWAALAAGEEIAEGVTLESLHGITAERLGRALARASHAERHLRTKLDAANKRIEEANAEIGELRDHLEWDGQLPGSVRQARADGPALSQFALDAVTTIEALFNAVVAGTDLHADEARRMGELRSALAPLWVSLHAITAQATAVERHMQQVAPDFLPETDVDLMLSEQECTTAEQRYKFMGALFERLPSRMQGIGREHELAKATRKAGRSKAKRGRRNG